MDILIGLVIAFFIISAVYVGYHASQSPQMVEDHDIDFKAFELKPTNDVSKFSLLHHPIKI